MRKRERTRRMGKGREAKRERKLAEFKEVARRVREHTNQVNVFYNLEPVHVPRLSRGLDPLWRGGRTSKRMA